MVSHRNPDRDGVAFGQRLKAERLRLRKSQVALAKAGGVSRLSQLQYEQGTPSPNMRYLSGIASAGVDVIFLLTGHRRPALSGRLWAAGLTAEQEDRIEAKVFDGIEMYGARQQPDGRLSADARCLLYHILTAQLAQQGLGLAPPADVADLLSGV